MSLIKKNLIHEGLETKHLGEITGLGMDDLARRITAAESDKELSQRHVMSTEEYQEKFSELVRDANTESQRIKESAEKYKETAEGEARRIIDEARQEAQRILDSEKAKGYELGRKEALEQMEKNIHESVQVIEQAKKQRNAIIKSAVPEILKLSIKVAGQVIKTEIKQNPDIIMNIIRDAIEKISDNEQVVIKVSQHDLQNVRNNKDLIIDLVEAKNLSIVPDKHTLEGGCMIETKLGYIDARIVTKLDMVEKALLAVYNEEKVKRETMLKERAERGEEVDFEKEDAEEIKKLTEENPLPEATDAAAAPPVAAVDPVQEEKPESGEGFNVNLEGIADTDTSGSTGNT